MSCFYIATMMMRSVLDVTRQKASVPTLGDDSPSVQSRKIIVKPGEACETLSGEAPGEGRHGEQ